MCHFFGRHTCHFFTRYRQHRGRGMEGRTPYQVFKKGIRKPRTPKKSTKKEVKTAA